MSRLLAAYLPYDWGKPGRAKMTVSRQKCNSRLYRTIKDKQVLARGALPWKGTNLPYSDDARGQAPHWAEVLDEMHTGQLGSEITSRVPCAAAPKPFVLESRLDPLMTCADPTFVYVHHPNPLQMSWVAYRSSQLGI